VFFLSLSCLVAPRNEDENSPYNWSRANRNERGRLGCQSRFFWMLSRSFPKAMVMCKNGNWSRMNSSFSHKHLFACTFWEGSEKHICCAVTLWCSFPLLKPVTWWWCLRIHSKTARAMMTWSHYSFKQRLLHKCKEYPECHVQVVNES